MLFWRGLSQQTALRHLQGAALLGLQLYVALSLWLNVHNTVGFR
jgi:hypothetical protein